MTQNQNGTEAPERGTFAPIQENSGFDDVPSASAPLTGPELLSLARLDYTCPVQQPEIALEVAGEICGTLGNFSMIYGKAKSRKSFLATLILAAASSSNQIGLIRGRLPQGKQKVVLVDTEQGKYHVTTAAQRVCRLMETPFDKNPNFEVYATRTFGTAGRLDLIEAIIEQTPDLGLLIIDGIRDVISSINDEAEATELNDKLLRWTEQYNIHIITVLHQNKGNLHARGHIGSEILNKAETSISVDVDENDKNVSVVEAGYSRNKAFETFAFFVNDKGLPEIISDWKPKDKTKAGHYKTSPDEINSIKHREIIATIRDNTDGPKHTELLDQIKYAVKKATKDQIGDTKAREFRTWYISEGWIEKNGTDRSPSTYYTFNLSPKTP